MKAHEHRIEYLKERDLYEPLPKILKTCRVSSVDFFARSRVPSVMRARAMYAHWLFRQGLSIAEVARVMERDRSSARRLILAEETRLLLEDEARALP